MCPARKARPIAKLVENKVEQRIAQATEAVNKARQVVAEAKKLIHKTYAVRAQARAIRAKKKV
jgi:hypothetical protein